MIRPKHSRKVGEGLKKAETIKQAEIKPKDPLPQREQTNKLTREVMSRQHNIKKD